MPKERYAPKMVSQGPSIPFNDAEETWLWYARCQKIRLEGARLSGDAPESVRPCDPDDIYRSVMGLVRRRVLGRQHLRVLGTYGVLDRPPDRRCREEEWAAGLWDEALDRLGTVLREKGIVA